MNSTARPGMCLTLAVAMCAVLAAADARAERPRVYAITHARIVTAPGKLIEDGTLVIRGDVIEAVGANVKLPPDAEVIEAEKGWSVYPAFIDAASAVGLDSDQDAAPAARGGPPDPKKSELVGASHELKAVHPEAAVVDKINPANASVAKHREMGFAAANVLPAKGVFRGESAVVLLRSGAAREAVVRDRLAQVVALETQSFMGRQYPSSRMGAMAAIRQVFLDAERDGEWSRRYAANPAGMQPPEYRSSDAALLEILHGERPVIFVAIAALDPGRFASLATEFELKAMTMARGLGDRPDDLGLNGMPLLLPLEIPEKPDVKDEDAVLETTLRQMQAAVAAPRLPKALDGGRKLAFVTAGMKDPKKFSANLAAIVRAGLDPARALAALTTTPAELLGVSRIMGTLETGKQANLMIVDGELFIDKPALKHLFVQGYHEKIEADKKTADSKPTSGPPGAAEEQRVDPDTAALAADPYPQPPATPRQVLIRNATLWTMAEPGIVEGTDILLDNGTIAAVGRNLKAGGDALVIDATGRHVTPGIIDAHSHSATESMDLNEGVNSISSEVRVRDVLDPRSQQIYQQLAGGVTIAHVLHGSGNSIGGQNVIVKYRWGVSQPADLIMLAAPPTIKFALGENPTQAGFKGLPGVEQRYPATRQGVAAFIRTSFERAKQYRDEWKRYNALSKGQQAKTVPPRRDLQLDALVEVLDDKRFIHSHSYRADEILALMRVADELGIHVTTFQHVLEGYRVADEMAAHGASASTFSDWWSFKMEAYDAIPYNAAIMTKRGVLTSLNSDDGNLARRLNLEAAKTVRYGGMERQQAFAMVTINPARQLKIDNRVGSLAKGKDADVVIWSGDPMSVYSVADMTFVDGKLRFSRELDAAHQAEVTQARARLLAGMKAAADKPADKPVAAAAAAAPPAEPAAPAPPADVVSRASPAISAPAAAPAAAAPASDSAKTEASKVPDNWVNPPAPKFNYVFARGAGTTPVAIVGATVHTLEGPAIADGVVVFQGGRITAVGGAGTAVPAGAERVDARGKQLWPGLIHPFTVLGIMEIDSVAGSVDTTETGDVNADADALMAVNPDSEHFPVARSAGITQALLVPGGGIVSGTASLLRTDGWTWEEMGAVRNHSLALRWPDPISPQFATFLGPPKSLPDRKKDAEERVKVLGDLLDGAAAYGRAKQAAESAGRKLEYDPQLEALLPVVRGERPLFASAREKIAMEAAMAFAAKRNLRLVITDARDSYLLADQLAKHKIPVILTNIVGDVPRPDDPYDVLYSLPAKLEAAGVPYAIASGTRTGGSGNARNFTLFAGMAAGHGLDREAAYKSVTLYPAQILGVDDVLGSIRTGKSASLVLTDGDLLEQTTNIEQVWIDGTKPDMDDVQKAAWKKWSARPKY